MASTARLPEADCLDRLVTLLDASARQGGWYQPHQLIKVEADPREPGAFLLGLRPLDEGEHPLDYLLGFTAPSDWMALGVVCFGWAAPADAGDLHRGTATSRPSHHPERRRVRVTALLDRHGNEHSTACFDDGAVVDEPGTGTVSDALRRCFGLATAPPPAPTSELFAIVWLLALLGSPELSTLPWAAASRLHPAFTWFGGRRQVDEAEFVEAGRSLAALCSWRYVRLMTSSHPDPPVLVDADLAAWMDDGMFARWVLADCPPLTDLAEAVAVNAAALGARVGRVLDAWR